MDIPRLLTAPPPEDTGRNSARLFARRAFFALAALAFVLLLRDVWILGFVALVFSVVLSFPVGFFARFMPRGLATLLTFAIGVGAIYFVAPLLATPFIEQAKQAEQKIPEALAKGRSWLRRSEAGPNANGMLPSGQELAKGVQQKTQNIATSLVGSVGEAVVATTSFGATVILLVALSLFYVHEPKIYHKYLRALVSKQHEPYFDVLWARLGDGLRRWVGGVLVAMTLMGTFTAVGLWIAGVQNWLLLGVLTFFGTFVPYVGAIASAVPGLLVALAQSPRTFFFAAIVYVAVHCMEGYVVEPFVMKRAVTIHPAVLLLWQLMMGVIFGLPGIVVGTPVYVCLKVALDYLYVECTLGKEPYPPFPQPSHREEDAAFAKPGKAS